jgi:hypothetical protein
LHGKEVPPALLPLLVSVEWVEERKVRWGVNSPIYQSRVLGQFPDISDDTLILPEWIEAAQKRTIQRNRRPRLSWDIAPSVRTRPWACGGRAAGFDCTEPITRPNP